MNIAEKMNFQIPNFFLQLYKTKNLVIILFTIAVLSRIPGIYIMEMESEPGRDGAYYYDLAQNIKSGNGEVTSFKDVWYEDWKTREGEIQTPSFVAPLFPYLLSFLFHISDSLLAIRVFNAFISSLSICLYFSLIKNTFNKEIGFFSAFLVISNPAYYYLSVSLLTEPLFIFLSLILFNFIFFYFNSSSKLHVLILSLLSALIFLTRISGSLLLISIFCWLLYTKKEYYTPAFYSIFTAIIVSPWLILNKMSHGLYLPFVSILEPYPTSYPPKISSGENASFFDSVSFLSFLDNFSYLYNDLISVSMFYLLLPFVILSIPHNYKKINLQLIFFYSIIVIIFHAFYSGGFYVQRYFVLFTILLIPLGVSELKRYLNFFKDEFSVDKILASSIFAIFIFGSIYCPFYLIDNTISPFYDNNEEKYEWLTDNSNPDNVIVSTEHRHASFFTGLSVLALPSGMDESQFSEFIQTYDIDFLVLEERNKDHYRSNELIKDLYYSNEIGSKKTTEDYEFTLVHISYGDKSDIHFFSISRISNL